MKALKFFIHTACCGALILLGSCAGGGEETSADTEQPVQQEAPKKDPSSASILKVGDKLFNLPSPIETAFLIEEVGGDFTEGMLNENTDATKYATTESQAMNLGVYGADLGYALIYGQSQKAFTLLATCKKLGTAIGISPALYAEMMKRFEGNMENKDSLLLFISDLNRMSDEYLKENESEDISAMILYGGWIESLYFTTTLSKDLDDAKLRARVGDQKSTLENLIGLIAQQNVDGRFDETLTQLNDLKSTFDKVEKTYTWVEPETRADEQLTIIKSQSSVELSDEVMTEISEKISAIRNSIIGTSAS